MQLTAGDIKQMIALAGLITLACIYDGELLIMTAGALIATLGIGIYSRVARE